MEKTDLGKNAAGVSEDTTRHMLQLQAEVAELRRTVKHLRQSEALYHDMVETSQDLIWRCDAEGRYTYLNPAWEQVLGYQLDEMLGKRFSDFQRPEMAARDQELFSRLMQGNSVKGYESIHIGKSGKEIHLVFNAKFLTDENGTACGTHGTAYDITERKQAEEALRSSESFRKRVFDSSRIPMVVLDIDSLRFIDCNQAAVDAYGLSSREETLGRMPWEVSAPVQYDGTPSREKIKEFIQKVNSEGSVVFEWKHQRSDGSLWDAEVHLIRFQSDRRRLLQVALIDITRRKQAEEEQQKLQNQLLQSQKMESVGRLAGGVAHDFNNMLSVIIGRTELAMMKLLPSEPAYTDLLTIKAVGERSANLTRQLLAFARRQTIAPKILSLNDLIESMLKMLRQLIGEDITLLWKPAPDLWKVKLDPAQLDQVLANLVVNARDAIRDIGKVTIETANVLLDKDDCSTPAGCSPGQYVRLTVSDTGCGMDQETLANVFEPFFTTKPLGLGTGLGLATVYGIVKQNNGFIDVRSEPGRGTVFQIYQPRHTGGEMQDSGGISAAALGGGETILLVEDEPEILEVTRIMLTELGYRLLTAATPGQAVRLAGEHTGAIHLLMTDVIMPEMNGRDLAQRLGLFHPDMKRLFMSGYTADVIAHHGVLEAGVHFIQKPFMMAALAAKVRAALDQDPT